MRYAEIRKELQEHFSKLLSKTKEQIAWDGRLDPVAIGTLTSGRNFVQQMIDWNTPMEPAATEEANLDCLIELRQLTIGNLSPAMKL